jgi:aryl-alcohol dehydrogenase-like predicted oxidoreductase
MGMRYKLLGGSGLRVSELCLGAGTFGTNWGPIGSDREESHRIFDLFAEAGGNFIDTSNRYQEGMSEELVGECISHDRDRFVIGSKYTLYDLYGNLDDPNGSGSHRKNLRRSVEGSLRRLRTDFIDLLWVHIWDPLTPIEETMRALDDLVRSGKVLYVGASNLPAWVMAKANTLAELRGWTPFVGTQIEYNLVERNAERDIIPMCDEYDMAVLCWSALSGGMTTGKYNRGVLDDKMPHRLQAPLDPASGHVWGDGVRRNHAIMESVMQVVDEIGRPASQVSLNWLRQQPGVVIPIFSARTAAQMKEDLGCLDFTLSHEEMRKIDRATERALATPIVRWGYPNDFLEFGSPAIPDFEVKKMEYGTVGEFIDDHRAPRKRQASQPSGEPVGTT